MVSLSLRGEKPVQPSGGEVVAVVDGSTVAPTGPFDADVVKEGQILKRGYRVPTKKTWSGRHFVLKEHVLSYWASQKDYAGGGKPRGCLTLGPDCSVGDIYISIRKGKKGQGQGHSGKDSADEYEDSGDEWASDDESASMLPLPPQREKSRRSAYASKAASKFRRKKEKEQLYCFKISWLESSSAKGTESTNNSGRVPPAIGPDTTLSFDNAATAAGYDAGVSAPTSPKHTTNISDDDSVSELANESTIGTPRRPYPSSGADLRVSNARDDAAMLISTTGRPPRVSSRATSAPITPRVQSPISLPVLSADPRSPGQGGQGQPDSGGSIMSPILPRLSGVNIGRGGAAADDDNDAVGAFSAPGRNQTMTADSALGGRGEVVAPSIADIKSRSGDEIDDGNDGGAALSTSAGEEGIQKHYQSLVSQQEKVSKEEQEEMMRKMFLASKKAAQKKSAKRIVQGSKIAATAGAVVTAGVLTAGVGLVVGLVFVGVTAAAGGGGVMAEASYLRSKGKTSMTLACLSLEEAQAWKEALEAVIRGKMPDDLQPVAGKDLWSALFAKDGSTIPGAGDRVRGMIGLPEQGQQKRSMEGDFTANPETNWRSLEGGWVLLLGCGAHGLRIFCEERDEQMSRGRRRRQVSVDGGICPPLRAHVTVGATPLNAFMCLMSHARTERDRPAALSGGKLDASVLTPNSCQRASFRIIETIDDHMDIIHLFFRPVYLFPSWTAPRDYVLFRYWRYDPDGSYMICLDSVTHKDCPPIDGYVRGEMQSVYTIAPKKSSRKGSSGQTQAEEECLLTSLVQVDPKGWVPTLPLSPLSNQSYADAFGVSALLQLLDVKDALDQDRFVPVSMDSRPQSNSWKVPGIEVKPSGGSARQLGHLPRLASDSGIATADTLQSLQGSPSMDYEDDDHINYDFAFSSREMPHESDHVSAAGIEPGLAVHSAFSTFPEPLKPECWAEPDANSFRVRGKMYKTDRKKFNAGASIMRFMACDIVETPENIMTGMCSHPTERVQQSIKRGDLPAFVFCVNIALPGPPCFHIVFYYAVDDISAVDGTDGTPSSKLASEFFFGDIDDFRDKTFKLIPQVVEGNFMVRKAVGCTPCIMGTKLKQYHFRDPSPNPRYCELMLDTGSDPVAKGVIRLCMGYAKSIVVDMAFLLEGNDESTLPERIMGCARLKDMVFSGLRFVDMPEI